MAPNHSVPDRQEVVLLHHPSDPLVVHGQPTSSQFRRDAPVSVPFSKKNVGTFLNGIRRIIKDAYGASAADLIDQLNPKVRGWANYHRHVVSKRTFGRVDHTIFSNLWQWARRRHPNKPSRWVKAKYFERRRDRDWTFFGETCDDEGRPNKVWLYYAKSTPIKRQVKVKGEANPYDPAYETYFEEREGAHMLDTFRA